MTSSPRRACQRGSATTYAVVFTCLLVTVALAPVSVAGLFVGERRAAAAADLAALAGASAIQQGRPACARAAQIASRNRARLNSCAVAGEIVTVAVATDVVSAVGSTWTVRSTARAGPVG